MYISDEKFNKIKFSGEKYYKQIKSVYCPYLNCSVRFNAKGLEHIKFKNRGKARVKADQYIRLKCISLAPKILNQSHTLQGYSERGEFVSVKINKRWEKVLKKVFFFEFVAVIKGVRVRIIVKKVGGEDPYFWSIIPFWKSNHFNHNRKLSDGNPEED